MEHVAANSGLAKLARLGPSQAKLGPTQAKLEPTQAKLEPKLGLAQARLGPTQVKLEPRLVGLVRLAWLAAGLAEPKGLPTTPPEGPAELPPAPVQG